MNFRAGFFYAILKAAEHTFFPMRRFIKRFLLLLSVIILAVLVIMYLNVRDRHPDYHVDLNVKGKTPTTLKIGFAAISITPEIPDTWIDANNDAQYEPDGGDTFDDKNGNGEFDQIYIAGFQNKRPAMGVHDKLWARTMVVDDGNSRIAITSIDAIGFMHDDVVDVRQRINEEAGITYSVISATHTHEAPDLLGLWGTSMFKSGVNDDYMELVKDNTARSIEEAARNLKPAKMKLAINPHDALIVVNDSRQPYVYDEGLRLIQAIELESGKTLGTLVWLGGSS